jgi:hypothetical protein
MKPLFYHSLFTAIFLGSALLACQPKKEGGETGATSEQAAHEAHGHVHDYACPMHPEMQGHKGEKCNTCGMPLEPKANAPLPGNYRMEFKASTSPILAGEAVNLSFIPKDKSNESALVPLDVAHEKKIHLIAVSEDLSWFDHIHPEFQSDGRYTVTETFPYGGKYSLYADYKPSGSTHQLDKIDIHAKGTPKAIVTYTSQKLNRASGEFSVTLKPDDPDFMSNQEIHFDGQFAKGGKRFDVNDLQAYLGAKGHMVGIHIQNKTYVHLHPEVENDILHFHATFPEPGLYRAWLQFKYEDKLHTVDFTIMVKQGSANAGTGAHDDGTSGHSH